MTNLVMLGLAKNGSVADLLVLGVGVLGVGLVALGAYMFSRLRI